MRRYPTSVGCGSYRRGERHRTLDSRGTRSQARTARGGDNAEREMRSPDVVSRHDFARGGTRGAGVRASRRRPAGRTFLPSHCLVSAPSVRERHRSSASFGGVIIVGLEICGRRPRTHRRGGADPGERADPVGSCSSGRAQLLPEIEIEGSLRGGRGESGSRPIARRWSARHGVNRRAGRAGSIATDEEKGAWTGQRSDGERGPRSSRCGGSDDALGPGASVRRTRRNTVDPTG